MYKIVFRVLYRYLCSFLSKINNCYIDSFGIKGGLNSSQVQELHERNLEELGLDYVDHLMTHFPKNKYCPTCMEAKMCRVQHRKGAMGKHDKAKVFGDWCTADH